MKNITVCVVALFLTACEAEDQKDPMTPMAPVMPGTMEPPVMNPPVMNPPTDPPVNPPVVPPPGPTPLNDECFMPGSVCLAPTDGRAPKTVTQKDRDSRRMFAGHYCNRIVDDKFKETYFVVDQTCAYSETCEKPGTQPVCVSCGAKGRQWIKRQNGGETIDCEGCACDPIHMKTKCLAATASTEASLHVSLISTEPFYVTASGKVAYVTKPVVSATITTIHKLDLGASGEYDVEVTVTAPEGTAQARIVGACK